MWRPGPRCSNGALGGVKFRSHWAHRVAVVVNLARLGLTNIVPAAMGPFPQLNPEYVVRAQPELVIATARAVAEMPQRPGWASLSALREGRACGLDGPQWEPLVRPGPRLPEAAEALADCLARLPGAGRLR